MQILMLTALCVIVTLVNSGALFDKTVQADLERYKLRVKLLHELLMEHCPDVRSLQVKRDLLLTEADLSEQQLEVEKKLYQALTEELVLCRKAHALKSSTTATEPATSPDTPKPTVATSTPKPLPTTKPTQSTTSKPTQPTTSKPTQPTTSKPATAKQTTQTTPSGPCSSPLTVNLTESWRKDSAGTRLKPINGEVACDNKLWNGVTWFRFSGDGGVQLSDKCRPSHSCGSHGGFWSNAPMPVSVGEIRKVPIYGSYDGDCNDYPAWPEKNSLTVQRCSNRVGDFVYKAKSTSQSCSWTFCGMDV